MERDAKQKHEVWHLIWHEAYQAKIGFIIFSTDSYNDKIFIFRRKKLFKLSIDWKSNFTQRWIWVAYFKIQSTI